MENIKGGRWISLIIGILMIINGVIFIANPIESLVTLVTVIAIFLIITGVLRIIRYFTHDLFRMGIFLVGGILDIVLGVSLIANQPISVITLTTFIGFWQLFSGISEVATSLDLKRLGIERWWLALIAGAFGIFLGFILITNLAFSSIYITLSVGIYMMGFGITFISSFFTISKRIRQERRQA